MKFSPCSNLEGVPQEYALNTIISNISDGVLIPTPYYGGFDLDLFLESEIKRFPVNLYSKVLSTFVVILDQVTKHTTISLLILTFVRCTTLHDSATLLEVIFYVLFKFVDVSHNNLNFLT